VSSNTVAPRPLVIVTMCPAASAMFANGFHITGEAEPSVTDKGVPFAGSPGPPGTGLG
jgi:hypothetical protein